MVGSRTATAVAGLVVSLLVSVAAWYYFDTLVAFLLLPFVPLLWRRDDATPSIRECPVCGFILSAVTVSRYLPLRGGKYLD